MNLFSCLQILQLYLNEALFMLCAKIIFSGDRPKHIAFITDGNRTYAKQRGLTLEEAYIRGMEKIIEMATLSEKLDVSTVTFFLFSTSNNQRRENEKKSVLTIIEMFLEKLIDYDTGYCYNILGNTKELPDKIHTLCLRLTKFTSTKGKTINLILNYSGKDEITEKCFRYLQKLPFEVTCEKVLDELISPITVPDLVIRTSNKKRLSDFLLWQTSASFFYFNNLCWPTFSRWSFLKAVISYQNESKTNMKKTLKNMRPVKYEYQSTSNSYTIKYS